MDDDDSCTGLGGEQSRWRRLWGWSGRRRASLVVREREEAPELVGVEARSTEGGDAGVAAGSGVRGDGDGRRGGRLGTGFVALAEEDGRRSVEDEVVAAGSGVCWRAVGGDKEASEVWPEWRREAGEREDVAEALASLPAAGWRCGEEDAGEMGLGLGCSPAATGDVRVVAGFAGGRGKMVGRAAVGEGEVVGRWGCCRVWMAAGMREGGGGLAGDRCGEGGDAGVGVTAVRKERWRVLVVDHERGRERETGRRRSRTRERKREKKK